MKIRTDTLFRAFISVSLPGAILSACVAQGTNVEGDGSGGFVGVSGSVGTSGSGGTFGTGGVAGSIGAGGIAGSIGAGGIAGSISTGGVGGSISAGGVGGSISAGGVGGSISAGGTGGSGGSIATGGGAGTAGTGGGSGGTGGSGGSGGSGSSGETCSGCARLLVPIDATGDNANFYILVSPVANLSSATITFNLCVQAGTGGILQAYVQHSGTPDYAQLFQGWQQLNTISKCPTFQNVSFNVMTTNPSGDGGTYDKTVIGRIGIQIGGGNSASWTNPTVIYINSITVSGGTAGPYTFDTMSTVAAAAGSNGVLGLSNDTSPAGTTSTWLGP